MNIGKFAYKFITRLEMKQKFTFIPQSIASHVKLGEIINEIWVNLDGIPYIRLVCVSLNMTNLLK